jgi:hypothetical protein
LAVYARLTNTHRHDDEQLPKFIQFQDTLPNVKGQADSKFVLMLRESRLAL